jgi:hypothetical protein
MSALQVMDQMAERANRRQFLRTAAGMSFGLLLSLLGITPERAEASHCSSTIPCQPPNCSIDCPGTRVAQCCCLAFPRNCTNTELQQCESLSHWCWFCEVAGAGPLALFYECYECYSKSCSRAIRL